MKSQEQFETWFIALSRKQNPALAAWSDEVVRDALMARRPDNQAKYGSYGVPGAQMAWEAWQASSHAQVSEVHAEYVLLHELHSEIERLRELAATCYAGLGAECNLPVEWLDVLNQAANGEAFSVVNLLPFRRSHNEAIQLCVADRAVATRQPRIGSQNVDQDCSRD